MDGILHALWVGCGVVLVLLSAPLVAELALLSVAALQFRSGRVAMGDGAALRLAVIVPAHNEQRMIARTVASLLTSCERAGDATLWVIAHNCTDETAAKARAAGANVRELDTPEARGKGAALAFAFASITADAFLIVDGDSVVDEDLVAAVCGALGKCEIVQCRYEALAAKGEKARLPSIAFRAMNVVRARGRARLGLSCGLLGNGFALRKSLLARVAYDAHSVVEDLEFHLALVRAGVKVGYLDRVTVRGEVMGTESQHARWEGGRLLMARRWLPVLLRDVLQGRWRMAEPALDVAALPMAQGAALLLLALLLPLWWTQLYALIGMWVMLLYVLTGVAAGDDFWGEVRALALAPIYVLRKIGSLGAIFRASRKDAAWVRTSRDGE